MVKAIDSLHWFMDVLASVAFILPRRGDFLCRRLDCMWEREVVFILQYSTLYCSALSVSKD